MFALFLPGAELTLHASVHAALTGERAMLVEALDLLGPLMWTAGSEQADLAARSRTCNRFYAAGLM